MRFSKAVLSTAALWFSPRTASSLAFADSRRGIAHKSSLLLLSTLASHRTVMSASAAAPVAGDDGDCPAYDEEVSVLDHACPSCSPLRLRLVH